MNRQSRIDRDEVRVDQFRYRQVLLDQGSKELADLLPGRVSQSGVETKVLNLIDSDGVKIAGPFFGSPKSADATHPQILNRAFGDERPQTQTSQ